MQIDAASLSLSSFLSLDHRRRRIASEITDEEEREGEGERKKRKAITPVRPSESMGVVGRSEVGEEESLLTVL